MIIITYITWKILENASRMTMILTVLDIHHYCLQVRVVKADDIWLSPNYQRDSCHLTLCIYNPTLKRRQDFYNRLYEATAKFNPRFHWGKHFSLTPSDMERLYPRYKDFLRIRSELDPSGLFLNKLMASTLGLEHLL